VLHNFAGYPSDGANPFAGVAIGTGGVLYGTTSYGGTGGTGTLFSLSPPVAGSAGPWAEALLHQFSGPPDGANPFAGVVIAAGGVLYGSTTSGGTGLCQVVTVPVPTSRSAISSKDWLCSFQSRKLGPDGPSR
jgi:uncharacterized repeat protein (TIGR03803 family)